MGCWAQNPCAPCSKHRNWGCSHPREVSVLLGAAQGKGSDPWVCGLVQSVWAALQTGSAKGVLHKHLILLLMLLSLLFNQVLDGCWYWLNSDSIHGMFVMETTKCFL